jgi:glycosyltransferase involved in cell wall biosynthesis
VTAARRPAALAKHLRQLGYRVIVLTSAAWGEPPAELRSDLARTRDLRASRLNWRRSNSAVSDGRVQGTYRPDLSRVGSLVVPEVTVATWLPFAMPAAARLGRRERVDCVLTTSGPESAHLIGSRLKARGHRWVADLRDGWSFEPVMPRHRPRLSQSLNARVEASSLRRADRVVTVSEPISEDLRHRLGIDAITITNGFDEDLPPDPSLVGGLLDANRHSFVHTGLVAGAGRTLEPLVRALRLLGEREDERVNVVLAGPMTEREAAMPHDPSLQNRLRHLGTLGHDDARALQSAADSLLLITSGDRRGELPGKTFEYLQAERPILVLGETSEAARLVRNAGAGSAVSAQDPEKIAEALLAFSSADPPGWDAERLRGSLPDYSHRRMAERMAAVVESALEG